MRHFLSHKRATPIFIRLFMSPLPALYDGLWRIKRKFRTKSDTVNPQVCGIKRTEDCQADFSQIWEIF